MNLKYFFLIFCLTLGLCSNNYATTSPTPDPDPEDEPSSLARIYTLIQIALVTDDLIHSSTAPSAESIAQFDHIIRTISDELASLNLNRESPEYFSPVIIFSYYFGSHHQHTLSPQQLQRLIFNILRIRAIDARANGNTHVFLQQLDYLFESLSTTALLTYSNLNLVNSIFYNGDQRLSPDALRYYILFLQNYIDLDFLGYASISSLIQGNQETGQSSLRETLVEHMHGNDGVSIADAIEIFDSLIYRLCTINLENVTREERYMTLDFSSQIILRILFSQNFLSHYYTTSEIELMHRVARHLFLWRANPVHPLDRHFFSTLRNLIIFNEIGDDPIDGRMEQRNPINASVTENPPLPPRIPSASSFDPSFGTYYPAGS